MLGKLGRLIPKLQRLRLVDARLEELQAQVWSLQAAAGELQAQVRSLQTVVQGLSDGSRSLPGQIEKLHAGLLHQRRECDLIKSKLEIPRELIDDFRRWKAGHPPPSEPLVSVCVATYNRAELLTERCIPSILGQTYGRLELIVVGDGCTDATEAVVARIRDPRLTFKNLRARGDYPEDPERRWMVAGTYPANEAISLARGDFITYLDDDDEYLPDRLEKLVGFALAHRFDFVWHPYWYEYQPGRWRLHEANDPVLTQLTTSSVFYRGWFKRLAWDIDAHLLGEPGDWNLFRRILYLAPARGRYPEPLLKHYQEQNRSD
jgi:hypothetical protein